MELHGIVLLVSCLVCLGVGGVWSVDVITQYGPVRGQTVAVDNGQSISNVDVFRAIPFAKDTSGDRRFRRAEPPDPWEDVYEAVEMGPACPQNVGLINGTNPNWNQLSEDCLHVDIYTPNALAGADTYPVMVYIYGGGFLSGANVQYPGHFLATYDVVVAVVNYRVREFGFTYTGNAASPGNVGLWDQREGLNFVVNNIRNFGGDPQRITVFGQSAGGASTGLLVVSPQTKDLFQQAIPQSGTEINSWSWNRPGTNPTNFTRHVAEDLGCLREDDFQMMDCLREVPFEDFIDNTTARCTDGYICYPMAPVIDGEGGFLPKSPQELRADGDIMRGPLMAGIAKDDGSATLIVLVPETLFGCCNRDRFEDILRNRIVGQFEPRFNQEIADDVFEALNWLYTEWPYAYDNETNREALVRLVTDRTFGVAWDWQMRQHYKVNNRTFGYVFDYFSANSSSPEWMGTPHGADVQYIFGSPLLQYNEHIREDCHLAERTFNDKDVAQSLYMMEMFTNFAKYGDPTYFDVEKPTGGVTSWPTFDEADYSVLFLSDDDSQPVREYRQKEFAMLSDYMAYLVYGLTFGEEAPEAADLLDGLPDSFVPMYPIDSVFLQNDVYNILPADDFVNPLAQL